uniref:Uncharacterized protein n=1 Tax=Romanomermis culicivorax TaxID=13658 RepID=A0A915KCB4_ROMCU
MKDKAQALFHFIDYNPKNAIISRKRGVGSFGITPVAGFINETIVCQAVRHMEKLQSWTYDNLVREALIIPRAR